MQLAGIKFRSTTQSTTVIVVKGVVVLAAQPILTMRL
jgi:hypothetical protein